jgi:hypothetical protein
MQCDGEVKEKRFGIFKVVKIQLEVFWVVLCNVAVGYRGFGGPSCLHLQAEVKTETAKSSDTSVS